MNRELKFIEWFNKKMDLSLKKTDDKFSRWDFQDSNYILELKIRESLNLVQSAEAIDKIPLYVVADTKGVYIYNLNKINLLKYPICELVAPVTTEFEKNKMITKYCYKLPEADATKVLSYA